MKTKWIEARQIGWTVEYRLSIRHNWRVIEMEVFKKDAIRAYDNEFFDGFYRREEKNGLARCVPVYVEASDEA